MKTIIMLSIPTIRGDWSWKPHPTKFPACFNKTIAKAINMKEAITPDVKTRA